MVTVPSFLLRKLYVRGSLRNTQEGVQFQLLNTLGAGYARKLLPVTVDGQVVPTESCFFSVDGLRTPFSEVSNKVPFTLDLNRATTIIVVGATLSGEPHRIGMKFEIPGLGMLQFDFTDVPSDAKPE